MGIVKPPWISNEWFRTCPFNYCDHFGDKKKLAVVCIICKEDIERVEKCKREGKDPYSWDNVFEEMAENFATTIILVQQQAEEMGIDLNDIPEEEYDDLNERFYENDPLYLLVRKYSEQIKKAIKNLEVVPIDTNLTLLEKAAYCFVHSEHYIVAKVGRAFSSRFEDATDRTYIKSYDAETSAFLAYRALERNSKAFLALAKHKPLIDFRRSHFKLAKTSLKVAEMIKQEFFACWDLDYQEFGTEEYDKIFQGV